MPTQTYVVYQPSTDLYLIGYNAGDPPSSLFGNLNRAVEYDSQSAADAAASAIGGGTVGTPKPHN